MEPPATGNRPTPVDLLLKLPRELRDRIYDIVLHSSPKQSDPRRMFLKNFNDSHQNFRVSPETYHHGLQRVSRQFNHEFNDTIRFLVKSKQVNYIFDVTWREGGKMSYNRTLLHWARFPSLQANVNSITFSVRTELSDGRTHPWIPDGFRPPHFNDLILHLETLVRLFTRTLRQRHGDGTTPLTVNTLTIDIRTPLVLTHMTSSDGETRDVWKEMSRHDPAWTKAIRPLQPILEHAERMFPKMTPEQCIEPIQRFHKVHFAINGDLIVERNNLTLPDAFSLNFSGWNLLRRSGFRWLVEEDVPARIEDEK